MQVICDSLSVQAPAPAIVVPLPIPVTIRRDRFQWKKKVDLEASPENAVLLSNVSFIARPGEFFAIIGSSGSGKTTLLNLLASRNSNLIIKNGSVSLRPVDLAKSNKIQPAAYVKQEDNLIPTLTAHETIEFAAKLTLPPSVTKEARSGIVRQTLADLNLSEAAASYVHSLSGGEKRRLSIACSLVGQPAVMILDEVTTGLDASTANEILKVLKRLTQAGRTIVMTVHAPRSEAFQYFDKLLILSKGYTVYCGPTLDSLTWFADLGYNLPENTNPLDFLIDITSIDSRDPESETLSSTRVSNLVQAWDSRPPIQNTLERNIRQLERKSDLMIAIRPNWISQTFTLCTRGLLFLSRDWQQIAGVATQFIVLGLVLGAAFYRPPENLSGIQTLKTNIFQSIIGPYYLSFILGIYTCCRMLLLFDREREEHLYNVIPYVFSVLVSYAPINILFPSLFAIIFYFMSGLREDNLAANLFTFIAANILQQFASFGYALIASAINRSFAQASLLANGFVIIYILTAGYLIVPTPVWVSWLRWINPYFYGFVWVARSQFEGRTFSCAASTDVNSAQCIGDNVLRGLRFNLNTPLWVFPIGLIAYCLITTAIAIVILQYWHPGGQRHAMKQHSMAIESALKSATKMESLKYGGISVQLNRVILTVSSQQFLPLFRKKKPLVKTILDDVNLSFSPGQLTGLLGPSGAGKSSLLSLLSARLDNKFHLSGTILINGKPLRKSDVTRIAFVEQSDSHLLPALTVRETFYYAARLRLDHLSTKERKVKAEEIINVLGLKHCADHLIGGELVKGISGGEKRRVSLGLELLSDPLILVCDEPSSGLDPAQALSVIDCLKGIAARGRTVIASLHQPRSAIFQALDNVILLAKGGRVVCAGSQAQVVKHFEAIGLTVPKNFGTADYLLDTISARSASQQSKSEKLRSDLELLIAHWRYKEAEYVPDTQSSSQLFNDRSKQHRVWQALPVVLARNFKNLRRQSDIFVTRIANPPFLGLLFFLFFGRLSLNVSGAQTRIGLIQETSAFPFVGVISAVAIFPLEKASFFHDYRSSGARYSALTFILAYTIQEVPMQLIGSLLFSIVAVLGIGLQHSAKAFFEFAIGIFCVISFGESVGVIFSTFFEDSLSVSLVSVALSIAAQTSGIFSVTVPTWLTYIGYAFPFKWSSRIAAINEYSGLVFNCSASEISNGFCIAQTGDGFLQTIRIYDQNTSKFLAIMLCLTLLYRIFAWLAVQIRLYYV